MIEIGAFAVVGENIVESTENNTYNHNHICYVVRRRALNDKQQRRQIIFESLNKLSCIKIQLTFFDATQALDEREELAVIHLKCNDETSR